MSRCRGGAKVVNADGIAIDAREARSEQLSSDETTLYQQYLARQRQMHSSLLDDNTVNDSTTAELGDDQASESSESSDEDEDVEHQGRALNLSAQLTQNKRKVGLSDAELGVNVLLRGKSVHDYDVRNKRGREKVYPFVPHKARNDDFGDLIKPEEYLRAEERDEINGVDMREWEAAGKEDRGAAVGQKRKWDESSASAAQKRRGAERGQQNKKAKMELPKREREAG